MDLKKENDRKGLAGTVLFHAIVILLMLLWAFTVPEQPDEDDGGVMVSFGEVDAGGPQDISAVAEQTEQTEESSPDEVTPEIDDDPVITNDDATAPEVVKKKKKVDEPPEEKKPEVNERMRKAIEAMKRKNADKSSNSGDGSKEGPKGDQTNTNPGPGGTGGGLKGSGFGVSLNGFAVSGNPVIENSSQDYGKVVLEFCVDKNGKILTETIRSGRGSTTQSAHLTNLTKRGLKQLRIRPKTNVANGGCGSIVVEYLRH